MRAANVAYFINSRAYRNFRNVSMHFHLIAIEQCVRIDSIPRARSRVLRIRASRSRRRESPIITRKRWEKGALHYANDKCLAKRMARPCKKAIVSYKEKPSPPPPFSLILSFALAFDHSGIFILRRTAANSALPSRVTFNGETSIQQTR